jgi:hypothetical protein
VAFSNATYRRIAAHLAQVIGPERQQRDTRAATRRSARCFTSCVAATDDQYLKHGRRQYMHGDARSMIAPESNVSRSMFHVKH